MKAKGIEGSTAFSEGVNHCFNQELNIFSKISPVGGVFVLTRL